MNDDTMLTIVDYLKDSSYDIDDLYVTKFWGMGLHR